MTQKRDLRPVTVYLTDATIDWLDEKGAEFHDGVSATVRRIVMERAAAEMQENVRDRAKETEASQ